MPSTNKKRKLKYGLSSQKIEIGRLLAQQPQSRVEWFLEKLPSQFTGH